MYTYNYTYFQDSNPIHNFASLNKKNPRDSELLHFLSSNRRVLQPANIII